MVVGGNRLPKILETDGLSFTVDDIIDMGAPRSIRRRRLRNANSRDGGGTTMSVVPPINNSLERAFNEDEIDLAGSLKVKSRRRAGGRRALRLYTPNPRLYPKVDPEKQKAKSRLKTRTESKLKKRTVKQSYDTENQTRVKRRKLKARRLVPNPRLYQSPPNRPRPLPPPSLYPLSWAPPPKLAPQETASQIALRFSERTIIPFREILGKSQLATSREKKRITKSPNGNKLKREILRSRSPSPVILRNKSFRTSRSKSPQADSRHVKTRIGKSRSKSPSVSTLRKILARSESPPPILLPHEVGVSKQYQPRSKHFRLPTLDSNSGSSTPAPIVHPPTPPTLANDPTMASTPQSSITPEEGSDGNDSLSSAPSEYLAEFLSAIMSRKYAEALKYCRLILHYEPQNAAARGFYPLLRHKLGQDQSAVTPLEGKMFGSSTSESSSAAGGANAAGNPDDVVDVEEASDDSDGESAGSLASLSFDSSGKSSRSASPVARGTDSTSEGSAEAVGVTAAEVNTAGNCWLADDNGNPRPYTQKHKSRRHVEDDVENENAAGDDHKRLLKEPTLKQLRAQFACSIK